MPRSRGRRPKDKKSQSKILTIRQQPLSINLFTNFVRRIADAPIMLTLSMLAVVLAVGTPIWDALRTPDISASGDSDPLRPFAFPFAVKNNSSWFSMKETRMSCRATVTLTRDRTLNGILGVDDIGAFIEPNGTANFRCVVTGSGDRVIFHHEPGEVISAHIKLQVAYKTLWHPRTSPPVEFTWYTAGHPPRWIKGHVAD